MILSGILTCSYLLRLFFVDTTSYCAIDSCEHRGYCMEALNKFLCDCNMTSYVGPFCTEGKRITVHLTLKVLNF